MRARWSLCLVSVVIMVASFGWECADGGRRRSQWSRGEALGIHVGVWGFLIWVGDVVLHNSSSGGYWDVWLASRVSWKSPPSRTGRCCCSSLRSLISHWISFWESSLPWAVCVCGKYAATTRSLNPPFKFRMDIVRWGWNGVGTLNGSISVYVVVFAASMTLPEARSDFFA